MIINSRLDTDFYQFTMGQVIWGRYPWVVEYEFTNRTDFPLTHYIDEAELRAELDHLQELRFTQSELQFLRESGLNENYVSWLERTRNLPDYELQFEGEKVIWRSKGQWAEGIFWETPALAIITELFNRKYVENHYRGNSYNAAINILNQKRVALQFVGYPPIVEFGTRRRFSGVWQDIVMDVLSNDYSGLIGTSNVGLAFKYGIKPSGTMAHQMFMVVAAKHIHEYLMRKKDGEENPLIEAQKTVLDIWEHEYPESQRILLTDTYGTPFFLENLDKERLGRWSGFRQDSGNPSDIANMIHEELFIQGISPQEKKMLFSDGLTLDVIEKLWAEFRDIFQVAFGWGTNLTNDVGSRPLSMVIKPKSVDGLPCVKLSDNDNKALGSEIEQYRKLAHQEVHHSEPVVY